MALSAVTLWELTKLVELGYLSLPDGFERFMHYLCAHPRYEIVQYDAKLMIDCCRLRRSCSQTLPIKSLWRPRARSAPHS